MTADIRPIRTAAETGLAETFQELKRRLPAGEIARRDAAFALFNEAGLPHRRVEEWKYTDLRAAMREAKPLAAEVTAADAAQARAALVRFEGLARARAVFVNGHYVQDLAITEAGVEIDSLRGALTEGHAQLGRLGEAVTYPENAAVALNAAFADDGAIIHVPAGAAVKGVLHLAFHQTGKDHAAYARVLVVVEEGASVTVLETHTGEGAHQTNTLVEVLAADRAQVTHLKIQDESRESLHLATFATTLGAEARVTSTSLMKGAQLARQQVFTTFAGANAEFNLSGVMIAGGRRHLDTTMIANHKAPGGVGKERFKLVLNDEARGVFQGRINVDRIAQQTDSQMKADALLLGESAEADMKPELEIFADDVICAHGATAGAIDEELLFYLLARGVPRSEAESLLITAFMGEVFDTIEDEAIRESFERAAQEWMVLRA